MAENIKETTVDVHTCFGDVEECPEQQQGPPGLVHWAPSIHNVALDDV